MRNNNIKWKDLNKKKIKIWIKLDLNTKIFNPKNLALLDFEI